MSRSPCSGQRRRPPSLTSAFSPRARPSHVTLVEVCDQTHEYCELFMIIRSLSIQSHDKLGAAVFKLMIIFICCIQTQLIVFMPNAVLEKKGKGSVDLGYHTRCHTRYTLGTHRVPTHTNTRKHHHTQTAPRRTRARIQYSLDLLFPSCVSRPGPQTVTAWSARCHCAGRPPSFAGPCAESCPRHSWVRPRRTRRAQGACSWWCARRHTP